MALEIVGRCTKCYGDSPKAHKREQIQPMAKFVSEYQAAYKEWAWHPRPQSMKPHEQKVAPSDKTRSQIGRKTTYGIDFVGHLLPKKISPKKQKGKAKRSQRDGADDIQYQLYFPKKSIVSSLQSSNVDNAKVIHPSNSQPFQDDTIYNNSYRFYDVATMTASQQSPIKGKDSIEISSNNVSTTQEDEQPVAVHQPGQSDTVEKRDKVKQDPITRNSQFEAISTAMADFTKPEGFERPVPCPPPVQNHFSTVKFDGTTTFSMAYKPFPVHPYELPIWARKPKYKRPEGGMVVNSLYAHDYRDPQVVKPPSPIDPRTKQNGNIITRKVGRATKFEKMTTYKKDFQQWDIVRPRESYQIIEVYQPPKEKMMFETNQRSHFKGEKADKMKPCRHISQHRELNTKSAMALFTTYDEAFRNPRQKKPASGSGQRRSCSAKSMPPEPKASRPATSKSIPSPDLSSFSISGNPMAVSVLNSCPPSADTCANNYVVSGHVDILKVDQRCDKCSRSEQGCTCVQNT